MLQKKTKTKACETCPRRSVCVCAYVWCEYMCEDGWIYVSGACLEAGRVADKLSITIWELKEFQHRTIRVKSVDCITEIIFVWIVDFISILSLA